MGLTFGNVIAAVQSPTDQLMTPVKVAVVLIMIGIEIFCAYQCAKNRRWGWFIAGFLCLVAWPVGSVLPRPRSSYRRY